MRELPRLYPAWAELGEAWLVQARTSRSPEDVLAAAEAFTRSLEIQPNFVALRGQVALANFRHRFDEALTLAPRAEATFPEDTSVLAMRIEALVSVGRIGEAQAWFEAHPPRADDFHAVAAHARTCVAAGELEEGALGFLAAAAIARDQGVAGLVRWARIRAAAVWIDSGDPARARALLEPEPEDPTSIDLGIHRAEIDEAEGRSEDALRRLERLLEYAEDPTVHSAAARVARVLGREAEARRHAEVAERAFRNALAAGEVYTLGALARLLADTGGSLGEALELARHHAAVVRLPESRRLVEEIERRLAVGT